MLLVTTHRASPVIMLAGDAGRDGGTLHCGHHGAVSHLVGGDLPGDHVVEEDGLEQLSVGGHGGHELGGKLGEGGVSRGEDSERAVTCKSVSKAGLDGEINEG